MHRPKDPNYTRVLPRDLFNEAKLLNGLGFLVLMIQNGMAPEPLEYEGPPENTRFKIIQDVGSGDLFVDNVRITLYGEQLHVYHPYNEKKGTTLRFAYGEYGEKAQGRVFAEGDPETLSDDLHDIIMDKP